MSSFPRPDVNRLIESYRDYAHAIAAEVCRKLPPQVERHELESAADLGLVEAAQAFDPSRGVLFKTFAYYRIRGAVFDSLRKMGWFSKSLYQQYKFEMAANEYLKDHSEAAPTSGDIEEEYEDIKNFTGSVLSCYLLSLDDLTQEPSEASEKSPERQAQVKQERQRLKDAITRLPEKNRQVIQWYYFEEQSLEEIGQRLGMSKSWICRVHAKSVELLREALASPKKIPSG
jgi:RNA polymerase sigma factor for flagellar operon FliA